MLTREELSSKYNLPLFIELSANNDPLGHCWLGLLYQYGKEDISKAVELYTKASEQLGIVLACEKYLNKFSLEDLFEIRDICVAHNHIDYNPSSN